MECLFLPFSLPIFFQFLQKSDVGCTFPKVLPRNPDCDGGDAAGHDSGLEEGCLGVWVIQQFVESLDFEVDVGKVEDPATEAELHVQLVHVQLSRKELTNRALQQKFKQTLLQRVGPTPP